LYLILFLALFKIVGIAHVLFREIRICLLVLPVCSLFLLLSFVEFHMLIV